MWNVWDYVGEVLLIMVYTNLLDMSHLSMMYDFCGYEYFCTKVSKEDVQFRF